MSSGLVRPRTLDEALDALAGENVLPIAGGVAVGLLTNLGLVPPSRFVAIGGVPGLRGVALGEDGAELLLGAATPHARLAADPLLTGELPQAAGMFGQIGNIRVRNRGTIGGNLALAEPAQDPPVLLAALGADVLAASRARHRRLPVATFAAGPMATVLEPGELVTQVAIPRLGPDERCAYLKFLPRTADDYATVSAAVRLRLDGDAVAEARIFCGSVGPVPVDCATAADLLVGRSITAAGRFEGIAAAVAEAVAPVTDHRGGAEYKREMAGVFVCRALEQALTTPRSYGGRA
jgi:carbon-monoxide dehydrogenase medium subunit